MVRKSRKCSACCRPCKWHTGPTGDKCPEMQPPPAPQKPPVPSHPPGPDRPRDPNGDGSDPKVHPEPGPIVLEGEEGGGNGTPAPEPPVPDSQVPPVPIVGAGNGRPGLPPNGHG